MTFHSMTEHPLGKSSGYEKYVMDCVRKTDPECQWCRPQSLPHELPFAMASQSPPATCKWQTSIKLSMTFFERGNYIADL